MNLRDKMKYSNREDDYYQTKGAKHWAKVLMKACLPRASDFRGFFESFMELFWIVLNGLLLVSTRVLLVCTLPISIPVLTWICVRQENKVVAKRIKDRDAYLAGLTKLNQVE